ncbi:MAG: hypothetical protein L6R41_007554 [Letrouitia leprolyta]|nr:MAG: hypothetical protein L6R41_007554 [Letrouitia leprolyta]
MDTWRYLKHDYSAIWTDTDGITGGNALGSAADEMFNPNGLVQQAKANNQPIIFVGINYRLGIYGYATSRALIDKKHANNGLKDQRAAFEWVKNNIAAFGGDPDNITAMGQSVGASSIGLHLTSYRGQRGVPFHKAMFVNLPPPSPPLSPKS